MTDRRRPSRVTIEIQIDDGWTDISRAVWDTLGTYREALIKYGHDDHLPVSWPRHYRDWNGRPTSRVSVTYREGPDNATS